VNVQVLRRVIHRVRNARWRRPTVPRMSVTAHAQRRGTMWCVVPDWNKPAGGPRKQYQCVDVLNAAGIPAAVVHHSPGFRCDWFRNETKVFAASEIEVSPADVIVIPEIYGSSICQLPKGIRQVILNQNAYLTLDALGRGVEEAAKPYLHNPDLVAVVAVSDQNADLLRYAFRDITVHRVRWSVNPALYFPPATAPGKRIAYMPRRRADEAAQVLALLKLRGILDGWEIVPISNRSESEVAEIMRSCRLFLSFSEREGLGLPPLEAMACGCLVVGFTGYAGAEFFAKPYAVAVEDGDVGAFAAEVERVLAWTEQDPAAAREAALEGSRRALSNYSPEVERRDLVSLFEPLLP